MAEDSSMILKMARVRVCVHWSLGSWQCSLRWLLRCDNRGEIKWWRPHGRVSSVAIDILNWLISAFQETSSSRGIVTGHDATTHGRWTYATRLCRLVSRNGSSPKRTRLLWVKTRKKSDERIKTRSTALVDCIRKSLVLRQNSNRRPYVSLA